MMQEKKTSWRKDMIGRQTVLMTDAPRSRMVFGIGPPSKQDTPEHRMQGVLAALLPAITALRWGQQIHGRLVASIAAEPGSPLEGVACVGRCDALITADEGIGLAVWTADCVPLLMAGDGVVAAVHSGWRGTASDIAGAVVQRFRNEYGVPPSDLRVAIGPSISGPRYEVGTEVIEALQQHGIDESLWRDQQTVDLRSFLVERLRALGIEASAIDLVGGCTAETPELASFRRDGEAAGRQWSLIYNPASEV